ncbi:MAG: type II toxin-antitoxin system VapC family toxin [Deltaproteobacteria bacterium]|nr:type II toxin-antitoxin system VapC family toxin [Deltaproteobacteria bacterium]
MNDPIVLDSFALVCFFHKEPGWEKLKEVFYSLSSSDQKALLSIINWGEFYYIVKRRVGKDKAEEALALLEQLPIKILPVDNDLVKEAAEIKSDYPVSYADAFCIALAQRSEGQILTNDPEFEVVQHLVTVTWLTK